MRSTNLCTGSCFNSSFKSSGGISIRYLLILAPIVIGYQEGKTANRFWAVAQYYSLLDPNVNVYVESENAASFGGNSEITLVPDATNSIMQWTTLGGVPMNWTTTGGIPMVWTTIIAGIVVFDPRSVAQQGKMLGFTLETNAADMAWISAMIAPAVWNYRG